ncbi:unnamed protein product [Candida verbasci]|uniref:MADS-box domain-containing protein n=1 Tax=Candida verbasci TaxID=1227364 RepID=A0A9W4U1G0_9ASCO|nr:unnamed protein product [Candida verbasci]
MSAKIEEGNEFDQGDQQNSGEPGGVQPDLDDEDDDVPGGTTKAKERRKIEIKFIQDKSRRHITFSKRKAGIMKKAYELSVLTGTQVLLLVVSETGLVYTFTTPKLQPLVTKSEGKNLIQACLNAPEEGLGDDQDNQSDGNEGGDSPEQSPNPPQQQSQQSQQSQAQQSQQQQIPQHNHQQQHAHQQHAAAVAHSQAVQQQQQQQNQLQQQHNQQMPPIPPHGLPHYNQGNTPGQPGQPGIPMQQQYGDYQYFQNMQNNNIPNQGQYQ